jgi:hypothetical protein
MGKTSHTNKNIQQSMLQHSTFHKFLGNIQLLNIGCLLIFLHLAFSKQTFAFIVKGASACQKTRKKSSTQNSLCQPMYPNSNSVYM